MVEKRVSDRRVLKLLGQWLRAGVMEAGVLSETVTGTPQGGVISRYLPTSTCTPSTGPGSNMAWEKSSATRTTSSCCALPSIRPRMLRGGRLPSWANSVSAFTRTRPVWSTSGVASRALTSRVPSHARMRQVVGAAAHHPLLPAPLAVSAVDEACPSEDQSSHRSKPGRTAVARRHRTPQLVPSGMGQLLSHRECSSQVRLAGSLRCVAAQALAHQEARRNLRAGQADRWTPPGSTTRACTSSWAPSDIRRQRNHVQKTVGELYAGEPHVQIERGMGNRVRCAGNRAPDYQWLTFRPRKPKSSAGRCMLRDSREPLAQREHGRKERDVRALYCGNMRADDALRPHSRAGSGSICVSQRRDARPAADRGVPLFRICNVRFLPHTASLLAWVRHAFG